MYKMPVEARYWVACIHYLGSITKMNYGVDGDAGQPPPVVRLNGYGDYVFNNVPVIINSFQFDMPKDVDYISTSLGEGTLQANGLHQDIKSSGPTGWAPKHKYCYCCSDPQYSRTTQSKFSLKYSKRWIYELEMDLFKHGKIQRHIILR